MLQLPLTPIGTFKLVLEIYEEKGCNRIEMRPQPMIDLQGTPNLLVYQARNIDGQVLKHLAYVDSTWVDFDPERHRPENFLKGEERVPKEEPKEEPKIGLKIGPPRESEVELKSGPPRGQVIRSRIVRQRKPIPKAGLDAVHVESEATSEGGQIVSAKVSNHVQPRQGLGPAPKP